MLRFRSPPPPFRLFPLRLVAMITALVVVSAAMLAFFWWAPPEEDDSPRPARPEPARIELPRSPGRHDLESEATEAALGWVQPAYPNEEPRFLEQRRRMVEQDLLGRDIDDARVLRAMGRLARHRFVSEALQDTAYVDHPLPIGHQQTISQPYIVALMTQLAEPKPTDRALDVGTGSGYQAAVLAELCAEVYGIEIVGPLAEQGSRQLAELGYKNATIRHGDGFRGWPEKAPFDVIIVAAAPEEIPEPLIEQLAPGGRLVIPVGDTLQQLVRLRKRPDGSVQRENVIPVRFVPMTGEAQQR